MLHSACDIIEYQDRQFIGCVTGQQMCVNRYNFQITTCSLFWTKVSFTGHCSSIRMHYYIDNIKVYITDFIGIGGEQPWHDFGKLSDGNHNISIEAEGKLGGCNTAPEFLVSWRPIISIRVTIHKPGPQPDLSKGSSMSQQMVTSTFEKDKRIIPITRHRKGILWKY